MGHQSSGLNFGLIGHQESWKHVMRFVDTMRMPGHGHDLAEEKVKQIFTYIPPRKIFDIDVSSSLKRKIYGTYIETFIPPDELNIKFLRKNIDKVKQACELCAKLNIPVVSLGGFSSIVLEAGDAMFTQIQNTHFTTGNTLTAAFIAKGVEKACAWWQKPLADSTLLIIGSTGDIGSACVAYFSDKVGKLFLCARREGALKKQLNALSIRGINSFASTNIKPLAGEADIIISVASSIINEDDLAGIKSDTIICDAGYPKNVDSVHVRKHERLFYGGMGVVTSGFRFEGDDESFFYQFPIPYISHGCLLEAIVLALEKSYCSFSSGRGNITVQSMDNILFMARKHGIIPAPLFNKNPVYATGENV